MIPRWKQFSIIKEALKAFLNQSRAVRLHALRKLLQGLDRVPRVAQVGKTCNRSRIENDIAQIMNIPPPPDRRIGYFFNAFHSRMGQLNDVEIDLLITRFYTNIRSWTFFEIIGSALFGTKAFRSLVRLPPSRKRARCQFVQEPQVQPCRSNVQLDIQSTPITLSQEPLFFDSPALFFDDSFVTPDNPLDFSHTPSGVEPFASLAYPPIDLNPVPPTPTPHPTIYASVINSKKFVTVIPADMVGGGGGNYLIVMPGDRLRFYLQQPCIPFWIVFPGKLVFPDINGTFDVPAQPDERAVLYPAFLPEDMVFYYRYTTGLLGAEGGSTSTSIDMSPGERPPHDQIGSSASTSSGYQFNNPVFQPGQLHSAGTSMSDVDAITIGIIFTVLGEILRFYQDIVFFHVAIAPVGDIASQSLAFDPGEAY